MVKRELVASYLRAATGGMTLFSKTSSYFFFLSTSFLVDSYALIPNISSD